MSINGLNVEIAITGNAGELISEAKIYTNLWFLLELLCKKFDESKLTAEARFKKSEELFNGLSIPLNTFEIKYSLSLEDPPNDFQKNAIKASFNNSLSIIWGPPGTGKTKTIAKAIEAHLNTERRVLLVSHANAAVDEALMDVAEQLKSTAHYQEGKIIRLGICSAQLADKIEKDYPLVILDNIAAKLGESLTKEKERLLSEKEKIENFFHSFQNILEIQSKLQEHNREVDTLRLGIFEIQTQIKKVKEEIDQKTFQLAENNTKLNSAREAGTLKRLFMRLDPKKIQEGIYNLSVVIDSKRRIFTELNN